MAKWKNSPLKQKNNPAFNSVKTKEGGKTPDVNSVKRKILALALLKQLHTDSKIKPPKRGSLSIVSEAKKES